MSKAKTNIVSGLLLGLTALLFASCEYNYSSSKGGSPTEASTITTTPTTTHDTTTTTLPGGRYCDCDLSKPTVQPPYTAEELFAAGQSQECPVYQGMDIRFSVRRLDADTDFLIAQPFQSCIQKNSDGTVTVHCNRSFRGVQWHVQGWSWDTQDRSRMNSGNTFKYKTTTIVYAECLQ